jgi:geranylgeranyl diphosphate synthase type I
VLTRARELVVPALRKAVGTLTGHLRTPAEYHFGWVEPDGTPAQGRGGKAVRPALVVLGAEAAGADGSVAVSGAVAMELIHNFSLVHDDIMDDDRTRHHRPTVWDVYGVGDAILVGDALHTLAFQVLLDDPNPLASVALRRLAEATAAMITGQAQDTALDRRGGATLAECVEMERNKTAALLGGSVAIGAILGGAGPALINALDRYGCELGLAFQAVDDVLGIWGDPAATGKPVGNDLRERKKSLPIALALERGGALAGGLRTAFAGEMTPEVVAALSSRLAAEGIRDETVAQARAHLASALGALDARLVPEAAAAELTALARFVVEREY